jgi:hypothetical protein
VYSQLRYSTEDATILLRLRSLFADLVNEIRHDCLGLAGDLAPESLPPTTGSLVATLLEEWLCSRSGARVADFHLACRRLGYLDPDLDDHGRAVDAWTRTFAGSGSPEDHDLTLSARYLATALNAGGVKWWASLPPATDSACHLALVQGGRCNNEQPFSCATGPGADVDISGCYGEALATLTFPVGVPSVWSYNSVERQPILGDWLAANENDLEGGLWFAVVHGGLPFSQDLLYSKLVKPGNIAKAVGGHGVEDRPIPSDFALLRREVVNGVITADVLRTLRAVCTNQEWRAVANLKVTTAVAYRRSDRLADVGSWCDVVLSDRVGLEARLTPDAANDRRSRKWVGLSLADFVGRLAARRKDAKSRSKDPTLSDDERNRWAGLDHVLKLIVNTVYGVLASRHFRVGNTVLANNITARARVGVWMIAKALGLRQSITDGGIYTPSLVPHFRGKCPGLDILSRPWDWKDYKRARSLKPLPGCADTLPDLATLDRLAEEHVAAFWSPYGLRLPFHLEHKSTFVRSAYWSKADYALLGADGTRTYKLRGKERNKRDDTKLHPTYALLDSILDGKDDFPGDLEYTRGGILKIGTFRPAQISMSYEHLWNLRPGDTIPDRTYKARYNNAHLPVDTEAQYRRRRNRRKVDHKKPVEWFEKFRRSGIAEVLRRMIVGDLK